MTDVAREVASVIAVLGVLALLVPIPRIPPTLRRALGLVAVVVAWIALVWTLLPSDLATDRLASPVGIGAVVVGVLVVAAIAYGAMRLVLAFPWVWFLLLGLALPFRIPVSLGSEQANLLVPLYAVIALGVLAWAYGRLTRRFGPDEDPTTPLDLPLGIFVGFVVLSSTWSADPEEAAVQTVFFYLPFTLLYLAVVAWWPKARALAILAATTIGLAVPIAVLALGQYATRDIFWNATLQQANIYSQFYRVNAVFFDPNILGRYLVIAMIGAVAIAWVSQNTRLIAGLWLATAILGVGLVVTFSRSSALMLLVALFLLSWRAFGAKRTAVVSAVAVGVVLVLALGTSQSVRDAATSTDRLEEVSEGRFGLVRGGLTIWRDEPVVGAGLGGFEPRFEETLTPTEQRRIRVVVSHNTPVTVLSEQGVVGFALFLVLLASAAAAMTRASWRTSGNDSWAIWTLQAIVAGIFVHALLYSALFEDPATWVLTASALAIAANARATVPEAAPADGEPPPELAPSAGSP